MPDTEHLPSSFRDPSGFLFHRDGVLLRAVNDCYKRHYEKLMQSGLYAQLIKDGLLVEHSEEPAAEADPTAAPWKTIRPCLIPFISYPYEWSFGQLKAAAMATLRIQQISLEHGMALKDASAYNIQFCGGKPVMIDTLSFEIYEEGSPWVAYRQFCQHFLAPLALMAKRDIRMGQLLRLHIDGIPLDLADELLGIKARVSPALFMHIHLHAVSQKRYAQRSDKPAGAQRKVSRIAMLGLIDSLLSYVRKLDWSPSGTEWADYYNDTNYSDASLEEKKRIVAELVGKVNPGAVWDLGANTGVFSRIAAASGADTVAFDIDPAAVEINYRESQKQDGEAILPLVMDLANPSPGIGWAHGERDSLSGRGPADLVMALALIHHLCISNNVPLGDVATFLAGLAKHLIIEFVPKDDSQTARLFVVREDVFPDYTQEGFEAAFERYFDIGERIPVKDTKRTMYLMASKVTR